jgi:hypothetical protein
MKKLQLIYIMLFCGFFFSAGQTVRAEQVASTINYNPSRMGVFSYLKISNALNLLGGVSATTLKLRGNSKDLQSNSKQLSIPTISTSQNSGGTIQFNQAVLSGRIEAGDQSYSYTDTPNSTSTAGTITLYGGTLTASNDSYIHTLKQVGRLKTYANTLNAPSVTINGDGGTPVGLINSAGNSNGNSYGLKLGNYDIKYPTEGGYEYKWVTMKFKGKTAKVLTIAKNGGSSEPPCDTTWEQECLYPQQGVPGTWVNCTCSCQAGSTYVSAYHHCESNCTYKWTINVDESGEDQGVQEPDDDQPLAWYNPSSCSTISGNKPCNVPGDRCEAHFIEDHGAGGWVHGYNVWECKCV